VKPERCSGFTLCPQSWQPATIFEDFEQHWAVVKLVQQGFAAAFLVTFFIGITSWLYFRPNHY